MNSLHPHWQTVEDDERPVRVKAVHAKENRSSSDLPRAKRTPAAIVGVTAFALLGLAVFRGTDALFGQVTAPDADIEITATGLYPDITTVRHGETIRWTNSSGIPHILRSDSIVDADGEQFTSGAIFPGSTFTFVVPPSAAPGIHDYASETSVAIAGKIVIEPIDPTANASTATGSSSVSSSSSSSAFSSAISSMQSSFVVSSETAQSSAMSSALPVPMRNAAPAIPENPHTVGHAGAPLAPRPTTTAAVSSQQSVSKHVPVSQPSTGIEHWTLAIIGALAFAGVMWKVGRID